VDDVAAGVHPPATAVLFVTGRYAELGCRPIGGPAKSKAMSASAGIELGADVGDQRRVVKVEMDLAGRQK
jgi:hypothetical protein